MHRRYTVLRVSTISASQSRSLTVLLPEYVVDRGLQDDAFLVPILSYEYQHITDLLRSDNTLQHLYTGLQMILCPSMSG